MARDDRPGGSDSGWCAFPDSAEPACRRRCVASTPDVVPQQPRAKKLSAVIACYRDAPAVPIMYERLKAVFGRLGVDHEIIFVNDASPDDAAAVLADLAARDRRLVVVNHTRNFGSQSAFTSGMRLATGDAVVLLDGDLQDPPELIESFYHKWQEGYDVVYGVRVQREATPLMRVCYKAFYRVFRALSYVPVPLDAGDFALLDRRVVQALNRLPERQRFLRGLRAWVGYRQTGVPYVRPERMFGRTTNSLLKNFAWARQAIISFSYAPLDLIAVLAFAIVGVSFLGLLWQVAFRIFAPQLSPSGFTTVIVLILFMGGVQLLCLSIIGSYLAHIYDEVKARPPYIVESVINHPRVLPEGGVNGAPERVPGTPAEHARLPTDAPAPDVGA
jgi:glycosyltransferase involved in cell wall biosynthesis